VSWSTRHKPPHKRLRNERRQNRNHPHVFIPQAGWPDLCAHCNAGRDEEQRGRFIHT
jgi:hypothetical protein